MSSSEFRAWYKRYVIALQRAESQLAEKLFQQQLDDDDQKRSEEIQRLLDQLDMHKLITKDIRSFDKPGIAALYRAVQKGTRPNEDLVEHLLRSIEEDMLLASKPPPKKKGRAAN